MAEAIDDIELDNIDRDKEQERTETEDTEDIDQRPGDQSILIIDSSNPKFVRPDGNIPNVGRDAGVMKRYIIHDKKEFLKRGLGVILNKGDGPSSTTIFDEIRLTFDKDGKRINGAIFRGKKIIVLKSGIMEYSAAKGKKQYVNEFKELLKKAVKEHKDIPAALVEEHLNVDISQEIIDDIVSNVSERIEAELVDEIDDIANNIEISHNELRELRGILNVKGDSGEEKIRFLEVERDYWRDKAEEERTNGNNNKALLYDAMANTAELKLMK